MSGAGFGTRIGSWTEVSAGAGPGPVAGPWPVAVAGAGPGEGAGNRRRGLSWEGSGRRGQRAPYHEPSLAHFQALPQEQEQTLEQSQV